MDFSLDQKTARLSVGELAEFFIGPQDGGDGPQGIWRAQLGTQWHQQLRAQQSAVQSTALFEVPITGEVLHHGWRIQLSGRIDQILPASGGPVGSAPRTAVLREIKTVLRELPAAEEELRSEYPAYFAQLGAYLALARLHGPVHPALARETQLSGELVFVEASSGLVQTLVVTTAEENAFAVQLERLVEFLNLRLRARERLSTLSFRPAFERLRPGQETLQADLRTALLERRVVFLEAPTGFGKTGALLECALGRLREGRFERVLYLTSKATGQLQVVQQLGRMTAPPAGSVGGDAPPNRTPLSVWHVRNKREHCVNTTYHCVRENCTFVRDLEAKWDKSDLPRFYRIEGTDRSLETVREAGRAALICPYEITRTALAFNDVWIGDYNYVFSPSTRGLFYDQPGFDPSRTLLVVDEAHNLPSRAADAYSHAFGAGDAAYVREELHRVRAHGPLVTAWEHWAHFLGQVRAVDALSAGDEEDARHLLEQVAKHVGTVPLDFAQLGPVASEALWQVPSLLNELALDLPRLWWSARAGELAITCLDAASAIGPALRSFGAAILASATLSPTDVFASACGLEAPPRAVEAAQDPGKFGKLTKRDTRKLFRSLSTGAHLLEVAEARTADEPGVVRAATPWRDDAYDVGIDLRVDTTYQNRARFYPKTAETIEMLCDASAAQAPGAGRTVAVFFPSYSYAESIQRALQDAGSPLRVALQPRLPDLAAQYAWVDESLLRSDVLFLVLGSSFAEGIDVLGGRVTSALVVGPALPEVNAIQRARTEMLSSLGRETAFRRVYQVPGIQKVNQALGRLVRAPGQRARILLHCRRFAEPAYASLLAKEYRDGAPLRTDAELEQWILGITPSPVDEA